MPAPVPAPAPERMPLSASEPAVRAAFLIALLAGAGAYTWLAFADLAFMSRTGRLGPGFFPRVIGVAAVAFVLWAVVDAWRGGPGPGESSGEGPGEDSGDVSGGATARAWADVAALAALAVGYAVLLRLLGGFVATVIFLAVALTVLERARPGRNLAIALAVPGAVYLLFDRALNANMPPALFDLPL